MAVKKSLEKKPLDVRPSYTSLEELCKKYSHEAYVPSGTSGDKVFRVNTMMKILREFCSLHNYTYSIIPRFIDVSNAVRTVAVSVEVRDSEGTTIWETFGVASRYTYTLSSKIKDAAIEVAQTVATGKALVMLGITPVDNFVTYSMEELELHNSIKQKVDPQILRAKAAELIAQLPEEFKKRARYANIGIDTVLDLIDVEKDSVDVLAERLGNYLETGKSGRLNNVETSPDKAT
jgi:hypothetical protein